MEDKRIFKEEEKQEIEELVNKVQKLSAPQRLRLLGVVEGITLASEIERTVAVGA